MAAFLIGQPDPRFEPRPQHVSTAADLVVAKFEDSTNISCATTLEDGTFFEFGLDHAEGTEGTNLFAVVEVRSADDALLAEGHNDQLIPQDRLVPATVDLTDESGDPAGAAMPRGSTSRPPLHRRRDRRARVADVGEQPIRLAE
jgi:hypothetical protein